MSENIPLMSDAYQIGQAMIKYYTYKKNVPLQPGQHVAFTKGKGYYAAPPVVPPPPPTDDRHPTPPDSFAQHLSALGFDVNGEKAHDFYVSGGFVNIVSQNTEISQFVIGNSNDSCIVVEDGARGAYIHDGVVHGSGNPRLHTWGDHGIYESDPCVIERVEAYDHQHGQAFSCRWPDNVHYKTWAHDTPYDSGVFDYSDGKNSGIWTPALWYQHLGQGAQWCNYIDTSRSTHATGQVGINTIPVEYCHATFDLRQTNTTPFNYSGDPVDGGSSFYNCLLIWDGAPNAWYRSPKHVNLAGNVVLSSAEFAQWCNADFTPKKLVGSPICGKAATVNGRGTKLYGSLGDVGRFQTA